MSEEPLIAVFVDFENLAIGVRDMRVGQFKIQLVLKRLLEKGRIVYKRAYCDWSNYQDAVKEFHANGIELIDIPQTKVSGKNSADIRMVVDALDLCYSKQHIDVFALISGDSDFSPLVSKLKENGKYVIGLGMKKSTSKLLSDNCDEFLYYEDLGADEGPEVASSEKKAVPKGKQDVYFLLFDAIRALQRENWGVIYSSLVKDTMKRKRPSFNESSHGYRSFSELLEEVQEAGHISLKTDDRSGTYVVTRLNYGRRRRKRS